MIAQIHGTLLEVNIFSVVVNVGGIGYRIFISGSDLPKLTEGKEVSFYTHLAVRENALDLYGFLTHEELEMFEYLIELPKIGPKSGMQIMSQADVTLIRKAALTDDATYLTKMSGIGKKTAEKIVLGLKDKLGGDEGEFEHTHGDGDVADALIALGYTQKEARDTIQKLSKDETDTNVRIKEALKLLSR